MKILIEGYSYSPEDVRNVLPEKRLLLTDEKVVIENVGCFRNFECDDFVFLLLFGSRWGWMQRQSTKCN